MNIIIYITEPHHITRTPGDVIKTCCKKMLFFYPNTAKILKSLKAKLWTAFMTTVHTNYQKTLIQYGLSEEHG